jgi:hypothetical protein
MVRESKAILTARVSGVLALQPDCAIVNARNQHRSPIKSISTKGWVAQSAEQWTENPRVGGSIPPPAIPSFP